MVTVGVFSLWNAGDAGCYWSEMQERKGRSLQPLVISGLITSGVGFSVFYTCLLLFLFPHFFVWIFTLGASALEVEVTMGEVLESLVYFRTYSVWPWLVGFSILPFIYRIWFWIATESWEQLYVAEQLAYLGRDVAWIMNARRRRNPFRPHGRIVASNPNFRFSNSSGSRSRGSSRGGGRSSSSSGSAGQVIAILIVIAVLLLSIILGFLTAYVIMQWADRRYDAYRDFDEQIESYSPN